MSLVTDRMNGARVHLKFVDENVFCIAEKKIHELKNE